MRACRPQSGRRPLIILPLLLALLASGLAAQSVADVAKKNKEQSKDKTSRVVITDAQLKAGKPADTAPAGSAAPASKGTTAAKDPADKAERDEQQQKLEADFASRYRKLLTELKNMEARQQEAQERYAWSSAASWQRKAKEQRKEMDALKEQGRKAGVPPGVFRDVEKDVERNPKPIGGNK